MKTLFSLIISAALVASAYSQTRNVLVGTNNAVVQPTNFWSADASNARAGLGIGTSATNSASAFQPSSTMLSNLASSNGGNLTNITISNVVGALATNGNGAGLTNLTASNITGTIAISNGGTGATNVATARTNLGLGWSALTASNAATSLLGYTTNGTVVANTGTNVLTFTNIYGVQVGNLAVGDTNVRADLYIEDEGLSISVYRTNAETYIGNLGYLDNSILLAVPVSFNNTTNAATTRANLGLGWSALTNSNAGTGLVSVSTNGEVVSPTNFWQVAPIQTLVQDLTVVVTTQTNNATNARNLYVYSLATNVTGISNTILLPTNAATFAGDEVTVVHMGTTNTTTVVRQFGSTNNLITLNRFDEAVKFIRESGQWNFYHNISFVEPVQFSGTNAAVTVASSRTNLGLGATNDVEFRSVKINGVGDILIVTNTATSATSIFDDIYAGELEAETAAFGNTVILSSNGISFNTNTAAATSRTNLGLGETNNVTFSALTLSSDLTLGSGDNIVLSTTNGTKIGTATNQLLGFYNQTPITQPSSTGVTTNGFTGGSGATVHPQSTFTGGIGTNAYTISDIVAHLKSLGLIAP